MGYFQVRCDSRVVNYDRKGFIRLATGFNSEWNKIEETNGFNLCLACSLATSIQIHSVNHHQKTNTHHLNHS